MNNVFQFLKRFERVTKNVDILVAIALIGILTVMLIPLPSVMVDMALTTSLTFSLIILLVALYTNKALEFNVFPSLLLMTTLFRLSLNVASTRLILSEGHQGPDSAGEVISAFGNFVVGNNYVIGLIVFIILVVINFVVITKGSGRVAEVAARFTLDALPGKQMSIDADLNAGLINEQDARARRKEIEAEADFYGAMDGASKFVRGDAIAGIVITLINIVGGLLIGVLQRGMNFSSAAEVYTQLTIGDGLVSQIPALIISTAAGMVVTRTSTGNNMGKEIASQLLLKPRAIGIVGGVLGVLALVPGLPTGPFIFMGLTVAGISWVIKKYQEEEIETEKKKEQDAIANAPQKEDIESLLPLDMVELEVGYGLISIVESEKSGDLLERIVSIRKQFALDLGIIVPSVHIRDNLQLDPGQYRVLIKGNKVGEGVLKPDYYLAMDPGNTAEEIEGIPTTEPAFGLDALWVTEDQKENAEIVGYTVVDVPTVMATHLTEIVKNNAHELFGRQEADTIIESFKKSYPKVVEELIPEKLSFGVVVRVLQNLLKEQISIRGLLTIFETLADESSQTKDVEVLTESVRKSLGRTITTKLSSEEGEIQVMSLHPSVEELVTNSLLQTEQGVQLVMDPKMAQVLIDQVASTIEAHPEFAGQPILLTSPVVRRHLYRLIHRFIPQLSVISHSELTSDIHVSSVGVVELNYAS